MVYNILKYNGPPCRECCGFDGPFIITMTFITLEDAVEWLLTYILEINREFDNYIISDSDSIIDGYFNYPWIKHQISDKPQFDKFLIDNQFPKLNILINNALPLVSVFYLEHNSDY